MSLLAASPLIAPLLALALVVLMFALFVRETL